MCLRYRRRHLFVLRVVQPAHNGVERPLVQHVITHASRQEQSVSLFKYISKNIRISLWVLNRSPHCVQDFFGNLAVGIQDAVQLFR